MTTPHDDITPGEHLTSEERDEEAPAADAVEQALPANPAEIPDEPPQDMHPGRAAEFDTLEQSRTVDMDEDYR